MTSLPAYVEMVQFQLRYVRRSTLVFFDKQIHYVYVNIMSFNTKVFKSNIFDEAISIQKQYRPHITMAKYQIIKYLVNCI